MGETGNLKGAGGECIIQVRDIHKSFNGLDVLTGLSIDICRGETLVVIGGSGCGKSVFLKHVIGILRPDKGHVYFDGQDLCTLSSAELVEVHKRFGMVFQGAALFDSLSVRENVAFGLRRHTDFDEARISEIVAEKLSLVGMGGVEEKMPAELSGGMKKRVGIARAIAMEPEIILYDEPTTGLDPIMADVVNELILRVQEKQHTTSVVVTHDMTSAYKVGTKIAMLQDGKIIAQGTPEEIQNTSNRVVSQFIRGEAREHIEETAG